MDVDGNDNTSFRLGYDLEVRLPSSQRYVAGIEKEQRWLPVLAEDLPLPIPALFGEMPEVPGARFANFGDISPDFVAAYEQLRAVGFTSDVFDVKTTQLLAFAHLLRAGHFAAYWHARAARRAGATWRELSKVVEIGVSTDAGMSVIIEGGKILTRLRSEEDATGEARATAARSSDDIIAMFRRLEDGLDPDVFASMVTEDAILHTGSMPPLVGKTAIRDALAALYGHLSTMHHEFSTVFVNGDTAIAEATVTYTLPDDRFVSIPSVTIWRFEGDLIADDRIYIDLEPLNRTLNTT